MNRRLLLSLGFSLVAACSLAQQVTGDTAPTGTVIRSEPLSVAPARPAQSDVVLKNQIKVSGPLAQPFKEGTFSQKSRGLLQLINPFAPVGPKPEIEKRTKGLSTRAWSTTVGWNPGGSAFPDATTHEAGLVLVSVHK
jgi:hypothetical protein